MQWGRQGRWLNSEKANVTFERPLYLLTLEEKVGREKEELTFLCMAQGCVSLRNSAEQVGCLWDLPWAHRPYQGAADGGDDWGLPGWKGILSSVSWGPVLTTPGEAMPSSCHRISGWRGKEKDVESFSAKMRCATKEFSCPQDSAVFLVLDTGSCPCCPRLHWPALAVTFCGLKLVWGQLKPPQALKFFPVWIVS